jgi:hypothetical protein
MVDPLCNDHVTLMDFGLVRVIGGSQITHSGTIVGTPDYMSPEQAKGEELDHRADIYSLGVTVYHMLTGIVPFAKPTPHAVMMAHVTEEPPSMTSLGQQTPLEVEAVVIKSMAKEPADRYQSAGDMARDLENAVTSTGLSKIDPLRELVTPPLASAEPSLPETAVRTPAPASPPMAVPSAARASSVPGRPEPVSASQEVQSPTLAPTDVDKKPARPKWLWPLVGVAAAGLLVVLVLTCVVGIPLINRLARGTPVAPATLAPPTPTQSAPTKTPQPTATRILQARDPIYQEDFTAPGDEWEISTSENAEYRVLGGVYSIQVSQENWIAWNSIGQYLDDFEVEFEVTLTEGDSYNDAGLLFRFQDRDNYYELDINGEGSLAVGKQIDGEWYQILDWETFPAIQPLGAVNRVRLIAEGDRFTVIVNDDPVAEFRDDTHTSGDIAPVVTAYDDPPARATFDNIRIWALGP